MIRMQSELGWGGRRVSGTQRRRAADAEAGMPSPRHGCWEGRRDLLDLLFLGIFVPRWSPGVALMCFQGLGFSLTPC